MQTQSHETRSVGGRAADSDEGTSSGSGSGAERKKKGSKVRRVHSETPVIALQQQQQVVAPSTSSLPTTISLTPSAVASLLSATTANDQQQQTTTTPTSAQAPSGKGSGETERRRLSSSQPGMNKRHSSETLYKGPPARLSPVSSVLEGSNATAATALQPLDLEHVAKSKKQRGSNGDAPQQSPSSGEVSPEREDGSSKCSPRRKETQQPHDKDERKRERASSREAAVGTPEPDMTSPRRRQPSPRESEGGGDQNESEGGSGGSTPKKSSTTGKLYAEITRGVRTHLRAASDSLRDHPSHPAEDGDKTDHHRDAPKEKRDKKEKHDKKENVIVRLFGSERHHKDKGSSSAVTTVTTTTTSSAREVKVATTVVPAPMREEVEIQITAPGIESDADGCVATATHGVCSTSAMNALMVAPSPPMSPFPVTKSGIRLIKVDSEHCINLPLINSEITAQRTSSKAVHRTRSISFLSLQTPFC
jgi:hypothetical protein